ncbi:MAG: CocE/NonD family hydrolase, partial [Solirubrobacterales bacterium]
MTSTIGQSRNSNAPLRALLGSFALISALFALTFAPWSADAASKAPKATATAKFEARGSVGEAYVTGADPELRLMLVGKDDRVIRKGKTDSFGSEIFYELKPGSTHSVRARVGGKVVGTKPFKVLKPDANPNPSFYEKKTLEQGLNYVTVRDGIELAMTVRLPQGKKLSDGPFPTVVEYSGYQTAAPGSLIDVLLNNDPDPLAPASSTMVGSLISPLQNYAVVSVQMRGSGCSGGGFDLFGLPTIYDGYDAIETVAAQAWVKGGKVGMVGISFS